MVSWNGPVETTKLSKSIIEKGDEYLFLGLRQGGDMLGPRRTVDPELWVTVENVTVLGQLMIKLERVKGGDLQPAGTSHHNLPYDLALKLVEERIWILKEDL